MDNLTIIAHKELRYEDILSFLVKFDSYFDPPFSNSVNLCEYATKLFHNAYFIVAELDKAIIGVLVYYKNNVNNELYIPYFVVDKMFQGRSIGRHMLEMLTINDDKTYSSVALEVVKSNIKARSFYLSNGFVYVEDRVDKYLMKMLLGNNTH